MKPQRRWGWCAANLPVGNTPRRRLRTALLSVAALGCAVDGPRERGPARPPVSGAPAVAVLSELNADSIHSLLAEHRGQPLLVNVWSSWCIPCLEEMPMLIDVGRRYRARGLQMMFISADPPQLREAARQFLQEQAAPMPSYRIAGSQERFIATLHPAWSGSLPATLLLDAQGTVRGFWEHALTEQMLVPALDAVLPPAPTRNRR